MQKIVIVILSMLLSFSCYAKKAENDNPSRQECVDILTKLREYSPKATLRKDIERFQTYYNFYFGIGCDEVIKLDESSLKKVIKGKQALPSVEG